MWRFAFSIVKELFSIWVWLLIDWSKTWQAGLCDPTWWHSRLFLVLIYFQSSDKLEIESSSRCLRRTQSMSYIEPQYKPVTFVARALLNVQENRRLFGGRNGLPVFVPRHAGCPRFVAFAGTTPCPVTASTQIGCFLRQIPVQILRRSPMHPYRMPIDDDHGQTSFLCCELACVFAN